MPKELEHYMLLVQKMIKLDVPRNTMNDKMDAMDHVEWVPPSELTKIDWWRATPSKDPHDALRTGTNVLSAQKEAITLLPLAANVETKQKANDNERVLAWIMAQVNKRRQGTVQKSLVKSSLKFDEVDGLVIDVDEQIKNKKVIEADTKRLEALRRFGRFAVEIYHPNNVHVQYSGLMPEAVLLHQDRPAKEVVKEWGNLAGPKLKKAADNNDNIKYYYYQDYDDTVVWITDKSGGGEEEIVREEHKLPFLPWVARVGGDTMEYEQKHRRRPLLYAIAQSDSWESQNILDSFMMSEAIGNFGSPRWIEEHGTQGTDFRSTELEFGELGSKADVTPGGTLKQASPLVIDPGLRELADRTKAENEKTTVPGVLQGAALPPGTAFSTVNQLTQTALNSLKPGKELAEHALADIYTLFLLYAHYTKTDLTGYGTGKADKGQEYTIAWDEIDPNAIYLTVELKPDVPLDRQQRANAAMLMVNAGIYSKERAMGDMGITDPDKVTEEMFFERLTEAIWQNRIDQMAMQLQQQAAMEQQQQQLAAQQTEKAGVGQGAGFDPNQGGMPPAMTNPNATREGVTGVDRAGNELPFDLGGAG